jgi:putative transposase
MHSQREFYPLEMMCRVLEVSRSGYYAWLERQGRPPGKREQRRMELVERIRQVHEQSRRTYGSPRVYQELRASGQRVCQNTVAKLMSRERIRSIVRGRFRIRTTDTSHGHPIVPNELDRCFQWDLPNQAWCADITYIPTAEGWMYLAAVIDLCSRKVVGWSMSDHLRGELCLDALEMAVCQRKPSEGLVHHSDRGVQYACGEYRSELESLGMVRSMSRRGNCYDNAVVESFFKTLKAELVYHRKFATRAEAMSSIFEYIEVFYNRRRRHSSLGYMSPEEYEASLN